MILLSKQHARVLGAVGALACLVSLAVPSLVSSASAAAAPAPIQINGSEAGRTFDGFGGMSVNGDSRLLLDYPPQQRSQILDYLYCSPQVRAAPGYCTHGIYGAALQRLKVEIGGDSNSTQGAEPSIERRRGVVDCNVGWEFTLLAEARKRNPNVQIDALAWTWPGWINPAGATLYDRVFSQDTVDYLLNYLGCAKANGTPVDTLGIWNENPYLSSDRTQSEQWIIGLRQALNAHGYSHVQLVVDDGTGWSPLDVCGAPQSDTDTAFCNAVSVLSNHYPAPGAWLHQTNNIWSARAYDTTWSLSNTPGTSQSFTFTGTSIEWLADFGFNAGMADVYLDGQLAAHDVDTYDVYNDPAGQPPQGFLYQHVAFSRTGLSDGQHTIKIVVTGDHNPAASGPFWIYSDAFAINGPPNGDTGPCSVMQCIDDQSPLIHYSSVPPNAGKPLWATEDSPGLYDTSYGYDWYHNPILRADWPGARFLAQQLNQNYVGIGITAMDHYNLISSYYDQGQYAEGGLMSANTPWAAAGSAPSYDVQSRIWVMAHTTQFTQPGTWRYVGDPANSDETGSCYLGTSSCTDASGETGSYVTLRDTNSGNYAIVAETKDATAAQPEQFCLSGGLSTATVHVWKTDARTAFANVANLATSGGCFSYTLEPDATYTFTSENTGHAGVITQNYTQQGMSLPYRDNFQSHGPSRTQARYFEDQQGAFETGHPCPPGGNDWCLQQVVTTAPIQWNYRAEPHTIIGNLAWTNYQVQAHLTIPTVGQSASVFGRLQRESNTFDFAEKGRYQAQVTYQGNGTWNWTLYRVDSGPSYVALKSGTYTNGSAWITDTLSMTGPNLTVLLDGKQVGQATDTTYTAGMAGLATGTQNQGNTYDVADFDDFQVTQAQQPVVGAIAPNPVLASSGVPVTVSTTITNPGTRPATNVSASLQVPDGWTATPVEAPTSIDPGATAKFSWRLEASSSTPPGGYEATLAVSYQAAGTVWTAPPTTFPLDLGIAPLDKTKMTATASSFQPGNEPSLAIDGNPGTFWHTEFSPDHVVPPQAITVDLGSDYDVYQLIYLPRQDGYPNGDITSYNVYTSTDGQTFTKVANGTWPGDASTKTANFTSNGVRYVRLEGVQGVLDYVNAAEIGILGRETTQ